MVDRTCEDCPMKDLRKIHRLVEKRALEKLPEEVREPLLEVKKTNAPGVAGSDRAYAGGENML